MIKRISSTLPFLLAFILLDCKMNSDVLASFKGGTVTRKELRLHYEYSLKGRKPDENTASVANQSKILEELSLLKIAEKYNQDQNLVSEKELGDYLKFSEPQFAFSLLRKKFEDESVAKGKARMAFLRILFVPRSAQDQNPSGKAQELFQKLQNISSKKETAAFISENTAERQRKAVGGILEPYCINCGNDPFSAMFREAALTPNQWVLKEENGNFFLLRAERVEDIYITRLDKLFRNEFSKMKDLAQSYVKRDIPEEAKKDAQFYSELNIEEKAVQNAEHYKNLYMAESWRKRIEEVMQGSGWEPAQITRESVDKIVPDTTLLKDKNSGQEIKYKDVLSMYKEFSAITGGEANPKEEKISVLNFYSSRFLPMKVGERSEEIKEIRNSEEFTQLFPIQRRFLSLPVLMKRVFPPKIEVSEKEVRDTYEAGKMFAYSKPSPTNPQQGIPLPYGEVAPRIRQELMDRKKQGYAQEFINKLKTDYQLTVATEQLTAGRL
ncbi:hypothetical protein CH373_05805 [Leptospira perolatii]|uniref:Uncharacterized protein n=1 Tax=Leptospira perolatii TaxID=2023191 RepID=A0A2M9ZQR8_9LEPT|nr:hypothetical protein [Leptospira perolatii]PJZ68392.1 hypothetical protein CH360_16600 [Leptospira perolatii]PJZ74412.1 hypothetical protein CH373_05805 [Leptospira perolatii]